MTQVVSAVTSSPASKHCDTRMPLEGGSREPLLITLVVSARGGWLWHIPFHPLHDCGQISRFSAVSDIHSCEFIVEGSMSFRDAPLVMEALSFPAEIRSARLPSVYAWVSSESLGSTILG